MKIEYRYTEFDKEFLNKLKFGNLFDKICYKIQQTWSRIHACEKELVKLYCKQAYLKNKEDCAWGICINNMLHIPENLFDCSTGQVQKLRNNIKNDKGSCKTCPYFITEEDIRYYNVMKNQNR
jgi:hypothetical protein